ncbi:MAG: plasmid mobilization relaxosome protein MobC [SAR324 cluster bacterium]|nr:plasmid mobilization relaxosome protein MobC [SAR324 cluster bacterium]
MNKYQEILSQIPEDHSKPMEKPKAEVTPKKKCKVSLDEDELDELEAAAKYHHLSTSALLRSATFAYLRQDFVIPDPRRLTELLFLLAKSSSNINQLCRYTHERKALTESTLIELTSEIRKISKAIEKALREPNRLK